MLSDLRIEIRDWTARTQHSRFFLLFRSRLQFFKVTLFIHLWCPTWLLSAPWWEYVGDGELGTRSVGRTSLARFVASLRSSQPPDWACAGSEQERNFRFKFLVCFCWFWWREEVDYFACLFVLILSKRRSWRLLFNFVSLFLLGLKQDDDDVAILVTVCWYLLVTCSKK